MTTSRILGSGSLLLVLALAACGGFGEDVSVGSDAIKGGDGGETDGGGGSADGGKPCKTVAECGPAATGQQIACAYPSTAKCGDFGVCISYPLEPTCALAYSACSCGAEVALGCENLPSGYTSYPEITTETSKGSCGTSGGADAGTCTTNADCGSDGMCGFGTTNSCTALGQCYPATGGALCNSFLPACACDGTTINTVCEGYPSGVASKPVAHSGACDGG